MPRKPNPTCNECGHETEKRAEDAQPLCWNEACGMMQRRVGVHVTKDVMPADATDPTGANATAMDAVLVLAGRVDEIEQKVDAFIAEMKNVLGALGSPTIINDRPQ